jgi:hypothetical protein
VLLRLFICNYLHTASPSIAFNIQHYHLTGVPDTKTNPKGIGEFMNIFNGLPVYGGSWNVINSRGFEAGEIAAVKNAEVVSSEYGNSVCFHMLSGGQTYIPLSKDSTLSVGDSVDLSKAKILTLHRDGNDDITRIEI